MPNLKKLLSQFNKNERSALGFLIEKILSKNWHNLDIKKLKGHQDVFRLRRGNLRIIFIEDKNETRVISIECRNEKTYKF